MKIGELASMAQCTVETVRYYEKEGLLPAPGRTTANYRSYGKSHVERLCFIRNCRALDMTHQEIRTLLNLLDLPNDDCSGVNQLLDMHIAHVDVRIADLSQLKEKLVTLRLTCPSEQSVDECGILRGLAVLETVPRESRQTHFG